MSVKIILVAAAFTTSIQGLILLLFSALSLAQYYCIIDFLQYFSVLTYIKVLYFFNPSCGRIINIGNTIDGIPDQAFIMIAKEPLPTTRIFYINCINLAMSVLSIIASVILIVNATKASLGNIARRLWVTITICTCIVDIIATISLINDTFYIRTLHDITIYLNARLYGIGNTNIDISWGAWIMVILYSRIGILFFLNIALLFIVSVWGKTPTVDLEKILRPATPFFEEDEHLDIDDNSFSPSRLNTHVANEVSQRPVKTYGKPSIKAPEGLVKMDFKDRKKVRFAEALALVPQKLDNNSTCLQMDRALVLTTVNSTGSRALQSALLQAKSQRKYGGNVNQATPEHSKKLNMNYDEALMSVCQKIEKLNAEVDKEIIYTTMKLKSSPSTNFQAKTQPKVSGNVDQAIPKYPKESAKMDLDKDVISLRQKMEKFRVKLDDEMIYTTMESAKLKASQSTDFQAEKTQTKVSSNVNQTIPEHTKELAEMDFKNKKKIHFPETLLSVPQRLDKLMAEIQKEEEAVYATIQPIESKTLQSTDLQAKIQPTVGGNAGQAIPEHTKELVKMDFEDKNKVHFSETPLAMRRSLDNLLTGLKQKMNNDLIYTTVEPAKLRASKSTDLQAKAQPKDGGNIYHAIPVHTTALAEMDFKNKKKIHFPETLLSVPQRLDKLMAEIQKEEEAVYATMQPIESKTLQSTDLQAKIQPTVGGNAGQAIPEHTKELVKMDFEDKNKVHFPKTRFVMRRSMDNLMAELKEKMKNSRVYTTMEPAKLRASQSTDLLAKYQPKEGGNVDQAISKHTTESAKVDFEKEVILLRQKIEKLNTSLDEDLIYTTIKPAKLKASQSTDFLAKTQPKVSGNVDQAIPEHTKELVKMDFEDKNKVHFSETPFAMRRSLDNLLTGLKQKMNNDLIYTTVEPAKLRASKSTDLQAKAQPKDGANIYHAIPVHTTEWRGAVTELQGQRPWAYFPAPSNRMRDELQSDEDLPPVPLPDYSIKPVHTLPSVLLDKPDQDQFFAPKVIGKADVFFY